jgi:hypothetical protein
VTRRRAGLVAVGVLAIVAVIIGAAGLLLRPATPTVAAGPPTFVDETAASGIAHRYDGTQTYAVGGGVAVLDCDEDGRPDLFLAGGAEPAALYRNDGPLGGTLHFARIEDAAADLTAVSGAYPLDVDGDGHADLAVLRAGENVILRGAGDCRFERANEALGFDGAPGDTTAFSATWESSPTLPKNA